MQNSGIVRKAKVIVISHTPIASITPRSTFSVDYNQRLDSTVYNFFKKKKKRLLGKVKNSIPSYVHVVKQMTEKI